MLFRGLVDSMLFHPVRGQWRTPAALGLDFEEVWLDVEGARVHGWWLTGDGDGPAILMFHGNAGTIADRLDNARLLIERLGVRVFLAEYPGYGDSEGRPSERSLYATGDAALDAVRARAGGSPVVAFGRSLGGAVAAYLATARQVDGLILESAFTSLADLASDVGFGFARVFLPYRFDTLERMPTLAVPLLVCHGEDDEIVPFAMGRRLYEAAERAQRRRFHAIRGARHNTTLLLAGPAYWQAWREFLAELE
jgi:fermentation-respiration switch protein FrsA (DUF1100 family)